MNRIVWNNLLDELRNAHDMSRDLQEFCAFPTDVKPQSVQKRHFPCADRMADGCGFGKGPYQPLRDAFQKAGPLAYWRETYRHTNIGDNFMDRFGCYSLIGEGGAFTSAQMWAYVVYMPAGLWYPWHHHPGEEMYLVLGGQAEFLRENEEKLVLGEGEAVQHHSNQPHAMETKEHDVMALVLWRNGFETPPVLSKI